MLPTDDEKLEPVGEARILIVFLGQGGDGRGMAVDEGGPDQLVLHLLLEKLVDDVAEGHRLGHFDAVFLGEAMGLLVAHLRGGGCGDERVELDPTGVGEGFEDSCDLLGLLIGQRLLRRIAASGECLGERFGRSAGGHGTHSAPRIDKCRYNVPGSLSH